MNPKKNIIKNNYDKIALDNAQKIAVFLRRVEYSTNMRKNNNQNKKINQDYLKKIIIIQKWWKTIYLIILIQKNIRGYLSRTKLIENFEKQEIFNNIIFNISYLCKKIFFRRFIMRLIIYDESFLTRKIIHVFFIINLKKFVKKWKENCDKINEHNNKMNNLKNSFYDWKKTIEKFSFLKSILKHYEIAKLKNNINHQNILAKMPSKKELNNNKNKKEKKKIENKDIGKEETKKSKKTLVFCFRKKNQIHNKTNENKDETEINNFINESYKMMIYQNKKNSTRNLNTNLLKKKFEGNVKNIINKNNNLTSRDSKYNTEISNRNEINKNNSKMDKICKTDIRVKTTKKIINEKLDDKNSENKKDENKNNKKETIMKVNITPNKEKKSKEYLNNIILVSPNSSSNTKTENLSSDNKNINIIIDSPFQNILNENTQGAIKNKDEILNIGHFSIKDIEDITKNNTILNKILDNDKLIPFDSIDNDNNDNLNHIMILNENDETNANLDINNYNKNNNENYDNQIESKKIKELVITFDKKPSNNYLNINQKVDEINNKIENTNKLNNINEKDDNIILDNIVNIPDNIIEKNNITFYERKLNDEKNNNNKDELKNKNEKFGSPTLIKKNNIFQTKIQFQKPTQNIELKQNNNTNDNYNNNNTNNNNKNDYLDNNDIDILNINEELENISKFKPPSKIKEIVIENLNINKNNDQRNDDFYTGFFNNNYIDEERVMKPNHSLDNLITGTDFYIDNLNQTQNYNNYTPINERYIKFTQNPNNEVLGYPLPIDYNQINEYQCSNKNNINNYQIYDNFNLKELIHKKTYSSNNLYQYKYPYLTGNTFSKKIIPNSEALLPYSNSNTNLRENQNMNKYNNISNQNNFGNLIYMKRVNICPPKNLNKTYVYQHNVNQK